MRELPVSPYSNLPDSLSYDLSSLSSGHSTRSKGPNPRNDALSELDGTDLDIEDEG